LALFSPEVIRIKGWRFSDEPVADALADTEETQRMRSALRPNPRPPAMRFDTILMDSWNLSKDAEFLLELEAVVDALQHGVNFLFKGKRDHLRLQENHGRERQPGCPPRRG
jgi:hypothetical protein